MTHDRVPFQDPGPYTVQEVCAYLRLSEPVVYEAIGDGVHGELRAKRIGKKRWGVMPADLQAYLDRNDEPVAPSRRPRLRAVR